MWGDQLHPFIGVAEVFAEPQVRAGLQPAAAQHLLHGDGAPLVRIRQHRQGCGSLLQGAGQDFGVPSVQAHPVGVLPGAPDAGEGQLQRCGGGMKPQPLCPDAVAKDAPQAEPERIAAGQHHHSLISRP